MSTLFDRHMTAPLAEQLRPQSLTDVVGQDHLLGQDGRLLKYLKNKQFPSLILWGPPGCGKTTISRLLAHEIDHEFVAISAIFSGVADLKKIFERAQQLREAGRPTLLFVDEIHRFNRTQQDAFLPYLENGTIILVGATTENPSFELNAALLSRLQVMVLKGLSTDALKTLLERVRETHKSPLPLDSDAEIELLKMADGDGRYLLNMLEQILPNTTPLTKEALQNFVQKRAPLYDKNHDVHYNLISALHKSLRGSDVDAALYWFFRMIEGGEDPLYIARRLIRFAAEDIGMADPQALIQAINARSAYEMLGSPEGDLVLVQALVYLATAPKSNALYMAEKQARAAAKSSTNLMPPKHILNAPTPLMKELEYGKGYAYDPAEKDGFSGQNYFPDGYRRQSFYKPFQRGYERDIQKRLTYWAKLRTAKNT